VEVTVATGESRLSSWATGPLSRCYLLGVFDVASVRLRQADQHDDRSVHWGFGCPVDGGAEPLGVWLDTTISGQAPLRIVQDLHFRGVERIWHVTGDDSVSVLQCVTEVFSDTVVFSSDDRPRVDRVESPRRREPSPAELAAERARKYLIRAIRRHGSFETEAAALDFVSGALQQMAHHSDRDGAAKGRPRQRSGAQSVPPRH
jgi:hypothetical protein